MEAKGQLEFSQRRGVFVVEGQFCIEGVFSQAILQPISQLRNEGIGLRNGTHVPRSGFAAAKLAAKLEFLRLWRFRKAFRSCEMGIGAAKWHSCAKGVIRICENFRRGWLWGCEMISQRRALFAAKP